MKGLVRRFLFCGKLHDVWLRSETLIMKEMTRDIVGRAFLFAGLTAAMYFLHLLSWKKEHHEKPW